MESHKKRSCRKALLTFFKRKKKAPRDCAPVRNGEIGATPARSEESLTISLEAPRRRRNAICVMLMPAEYFVARPYLELLNTLVEAGLV